MFTEGFWTAPNGERYTWGVSHMKKPHPGCINGGRVEWVGVWDEEGSTYYRDAWPWRPVEDNNAKTLISALVERFDWEGEQ